MNKIEQARELLGDNYVIVPIASWNHGAEDYARVKTELEEKERILQQSRKAMIAALKHIDGSAKLFSHRTKSVVLLQLSEALKPLNYPLPNYIKER